jgi:hypothetical protein
MLPFLPTADYRGLSPILVGLVGKVWYCAHKSAKTENAAGVFWLWKACGRLRIPSPIETGMADLKALPEKA